MDILERLNDSDLGETRFGPMLQDAINEIKNLCQQLAYQEARAAANFNALQEEYGRKFQ